MRNYHFGFTLGSTAGIIIGAIVMYMARANAAPSPIDHASVDQCGPVTLDSLEERMTRLEDLMWQFHAPHNRHQKLPQDWVERHLRRMRNDQIAREQLAWSQCPPEDFGDGS